MSLLHHLIPDIDAIPHRFDGTVRDNHWQDFRDAIAKHGDKDQQAFLQSLQDDATATALLDCVFSHSHFLSQGIFCSLNFFCELAQHGYEESMNKQMDLLRKLARCDSISELKRDIRHIRRRVSLLIALADITRSWDLDKVMHHLSEFADACVVASMRCLLRDAVKRGEIALNDLDKPELGSGILVLAMGKLGGYELNYSSDIDLIVFYEPEILDYKGRKHARHFYIHLTQELVDVLNDRTKDGYVFRVDLRLRPDPGSTPSAVSLDAAEAYYETLGQNWERAAMIKSRPIIYDPPALEHFDHIITPYVWRRTLDFASIEDIHSIKRQIDNKIDSLPDKLYKYHVKLGAGGIREIEFFAQTQQLIFGGRRPDLRVSRTQEALEILVDKQEVSRHAADSLLEAYHFYRELEHRLQMQHDQQTHSLPDNDEDMGALARFMGFNNTAEFMTRLKHHITTVQSHYSKLFDSSAPLTVRTAEISGSLVFTGSDHDPNTLVTLRGMGFVVPEKVSETVRGWHHGRYRSTRSRRSRELLTELMPALLDSLSRTPDPDKAFESFDDFLDKLPSGVQIFSLFYANPKLLDLIAEILGSYPFIAAKLNHHPALLDYVLAPEFYDSIPDVNRLQETMIDSLPPEASDFEDLLEHTRRWAHDRQFRVGIQVIKRQLNELEAAQALSQIADVTLNFLLDKILEEFAVKYGHIEGGKVAVVALGKLGSRELLFGSDLDLVFMYDHPDSVDHSDGNKQLSISQYYTRLSRRFINALSALTPEGTLYEIDLRLRPSGNDGPIATQLAAFKHYYEEGSAWAWEHMALSRARVVASTNTDFAEEVEETIHTILCQERDHDDFIGGLSSMHRKFHKNFKTDNPFNIKYVHGGMLDLEYIVKGLALLHAHENPSVIEPHVLATIAELHHANIIDASQEQALRNARILYGSILCVLRLLQIEGDIPQHFSRHTQDILVRHVGVQDFDELKKILEKTEENVHTTLAKLLENVEAS